MSVTGNKEHGSFFIEEIFPRVVLGRLNGAWNLDMAQRACDDVIALAEKLKDKPWAVITDMRHWELAPQEVFKAFEATQAQLMTKNLRVHAIIPSNKIQESMVQRSQNVQSMLNQVFLDYDEAVNWCLRQLEMIEE
ncbi:hypothetical protein [Dongshaea marina]|uniref:hypothetical protein n=1 Tax=Dongshaea marina TaxID=2047966 RepID=UPI000D3E8403|nr:hypothetical protein [Dongshaea marina]